MCPAGQVQCRCWSRGTALCEARAAWQGLRVGRHSGEALHLEVQKQACWDPPNIHIHLPYGGSLVINAKCPCRIPQTLLP